MIQTTIKKIRSRTATRIPNNNRRMETKQMDKAMKETDKVVKQMDRAAIALAPLKRDKLEAQEAQEMAAVQVWQA